MLSKIEKGLEWNGSRGRCGWIMKERERIVALGDGDWERQVCGSWGKSPAKTCAVTTVGGHLWSALSAAWKDCGYSYRFQCVGSEMHLIHLHTLSMGSFSSSTLALFLEGWIFLSSRWNQIMKSERWIGKQSWTCLLLFINGAAKRDLILTSVPVWRSAPALVG